MECRTQEQMWDDCSSRANTRENVPNAVWHIEMYKVMRAFCETGYGNTMPLDHTPRFVEATRRFDAPGTAYAIGYMRSHCFIARWSGQKQS